MRDNDGNSLIEFALIFPVLLFVILGGIDLSMGILQLTRLNGVTQFAALAEYNTPGAGVGFGESHMPQATFTMNGEGNCIVGNLPYNPYIIPAAWFPTLTAQVCFPARPA